MEQTTGNYNKSSSSMNKLGSLLKSIQENKFSAYRFY